MALRVSQLVEEISATGQTPLLRVSQLVEEVSATGQIPLLRVSQLVMEVSVELNSASIFDSLANWGDSVDTTLESSILNLPITVDDDLNNWGVSIDNTLYAFLTLDIADDANTWDDLLEVLLAVHLWEGGSGSWPIWHDEVSLSLGGFLSVTQSDDLNNWGDATGNALQYAPSFGDTLSLSDAILLNVNIPLLQADSLNNWLDAFEYLSAIILRFGDLFRLSDRLQVSFQNGRSGSDTLSLSDIVNLILKSEMEFSDTLLMDDVVSTSVAYDLTSVSVSDSLNNWLDDVDIYGTLPEDDYYRRYLNDRVYLLGDQLQSYNDSLELDDLVEVELV